MVVNQNIKKTKSRLYQYLINQKPALYKHNQSKIDISLIWYLVFINQIIIKLNRDQTKIWTE